MSNLSDSTEENKTTATADTGKTKRWGFIQNDLTDALNTWKELEKAEIQLSPEEEQLVKIKSIISQLQKKLENF